jgi:hypothetical protein
MTYQRKWLQSADVMVCQTTGAVLVRALSSSAQGDFDLLEFPLYHTEGIEDVVWDVRFALAELTDTAFAAPLVAGDTSVSFAGLFARVDYRGVPGGIEALTADGIATKMSEADSLLKSGLLLVPMNAAALAKLIPGKKYIRRSSQKARGHEEWSVNHDEIIVW